MYGQEGEKWSCRTIYCCLKTSAVGGQKTQLSCKNRTLFALIGLVLKNNAASNVSSQPLHNCQELKLCAIGITAKLVLVYFASFIIWGEE
jgi:hypothetical protein